MGDDGTNNIQRHRSRSWIRWLLISLGTIFLLLTVFHGPILRAVLHAVAVKVAAGENLKLDFRIEGSVLGGITLRNVHATPTGPSAVQALDADLIRADYSLTDLLFHGMSDFLKDIEVRNVTAVIDPSKAPLATPTPPPENEKISLPAYFPDRLQVSNVNLTVRGDGQDTILRDFNLGLYPDKEGALRIDRLQIPNVHDWKNITATTTYAKKNLFLKNLTFDEGHHFQTINIDASKAGGGKLELQVTGSVGEGTIEGNVGLSTTKSSYETTTKVKATGISLGQLSEYFGRPAGALAGEVKNFAMDWKGTLDAPQTWAGTITAQVDNVKQGGIALDHVGLDIVADKGTATVREARIDRGMNHIQLDGTVQLPKTTEGFRRTPGDLKLKIDAPNLQELTAFMSPPVTGSLQANGTIKTDQSIARVELTAKGDLIGFDKAAVNTLTAKISATKKLPATDATEEPFYENLTSSISAQLNDVRYDQQVVDRVEAEVRSNGAMVSLEPVSVQRKANSLVVRGTYQLPPPNGKPLDQPADLELALRAPELADFWRDDAPGKVSGELQADGSVQIRKGIASGRLDLSGREIAAQKLRVEQLSAQLAIAQNVAYLNDLTAAMNEKDYVRANGTLKLQKPFAYSGAVTANVADLSTFEPLLATEEKKTPLAGSLVVNWNGHGEVSSFKNTGDLMLKLEKARYAEMENLQANIEAHYNPQELQVPLIYLASDKLNLQTSVQAKDGRLEISNLQIVQGKSKYATAYAAIPFYWERLGTGQPLFPPSGKVQINFQSENLDLGELFQNFGAKAPVSGQLTVKLDADGPLEQLQANLDLQLQSLRSDAVKQLEPATVNLAFRLQENELKLNRKYPATAHSTDPDHGESAAQRGQVNRDEKARRADARKRPHPNAAELGQFRPAICSRAQPARRHGRARRQRPRHDRPPRPEWVGRHEHQRRAL